jgi:subtilisin family serine protease
MSQGINNGSHNGKGVVVEAIEELCKQDIPVVISVGNEGDDNITLHKIFKSDKDTLRGMMNSEVSRIDGYTYSDSPLTMQLILVKSEETDDFSFEDATYTILWQSPVIDSEKGNVFATTSDKISALAEGFEGELSIGISKEESGTHLACYYIGEMAEDYFFEIIICSKKGTELYLFDCPFNSMDRKGYSDSEAIYTMSDWATAPDVVSVGSYCANLTVRGLRQKPEKDDENKLNDIWKNSSYGVGFNGVQSPTLCAPGVNIVSATNHYYVENEETNFDEDFESDFEIEDLSEPLEEMMWKGFHYTSESGTSQASPVVAGVIAQWLEADSSLTVAQIRNILEKSCKNDKYTRASAERFGFGKLDAKKGLELVLEQKATGIGSVNVSDNNTDNTYPALRGVYMLDGRRVEGTPSKRLYIINGKKVLLK